MSGKPSGSFTASAALQRIRSSSLRVPQGPAGPDVISLAMGEPGFDTPEPIRRAAAQALTAGFTHYAHPHGDPELRSVLAGRVSELAGTRYEPSQVLVTHGGTGGLTAAILAIVDPGDRVVFPDPTYSLYADLVQLAGGQCVPVPLRADLHWDLEALGRALEGARLFVFCNPSNPTGIVHDAAELSALADLLEGTGTLVLADEAYSELVYTAEPFASALRVPGLAERCVYCQTFSKAYAMTGWRIGYLAGPPDMIAAAARVHETFDGAVNSATQRAAITAVTTSQAAIEEMRAGYRVRRELMVDALAGIPAFELAVPDGAFYAFPRYACDLPAVDLVAHLRAFGVAVRPGSEFGRAGEHHIRLSFAATPQAIEAGIDRIRAALEHLPTPG